MEKRVRRGVEIMNREIKFRGKRLDNGKWVYGLIMLQEFGNPKYAGISGRAIDPATIGQYTGLEDKNGNEIYEGDIIDIGDELVKVVWNECGFAYRGDGYISDQLADVHYISDVIGNIHDDLELLGSEVE
jgi:hypothetical protein